MNRSILSSDVGGASGVRGAVVVGLKCLVVGLLLSCGARSSEAAAEPFLDICVNVSNVLTVVEDTMKEMEAAKAAGQPAEGGAAGGQDLSFKMASQIVKSLQIGTVHLFLYPDKELKAAPVVMIDNVSRKALDPLLAEGGMLSSVFVKEKEGVYKFVAPPEEPEEEGEESEEETAEGGAPKPAVKAAPAVKSQPGKTAAPKAKPSDQFRLWLNPKGAIIGPISLVQSGAGSPLSPLTSAVAKLSPAKTNANFLVSLSAVLPNMTNTDWAASLQENPLLNQGEAAMAASFGASILEGITAPLRQTKALSFSLSLKKDKSRSVQYSQWFRAPGEAAKVHAKLKGGTAADEEPGIVSALVGVTRDQAVKSQFTVQPDNSVQISVTWAKTNDEQVISPLMGAVMQMMMGGMGEITMGAGGDEGPVETKYTSAPKVEASVDPAALQAILKKELSGKLFAGRYWAQEDGGAVQVECDELAFPNSALTEIAYEVVAVTAPDGASVMRVTKEEGRGEFWKGFQGMANQIAVPVAKGTKEERLDKARIRFTFKVPTRLAVFDVSTNDVGKKLTKDGATLTVKELKGHSVSVVFSGGDSAEVFACDKTGQYLAQSSSSMMNSSKSVSFSGDPVKAKVVVVVKQEPVQVETTVNLLKGKGLEFPEEPSDTVPSRCDNAAAKAFKACSQAQVDAWKVEWQQVDKGDPFEGNLVVRLNESEFNGEQRWKVFYFGKGKPLSVTGNTGSSGGSGGASIYYSANDGEKAGIQAAFGYLEIAVPGDVAQLTFDKPAGTAAVERVTASGTKASVAFNKNHLLVTVPRDRVLDVRALDGEGRALKEEGANGFNEQMTYRFWGTPKKVVLTVADKQLKRRIPIDLTRPGVDMKAYESFKKNIAAMAKAAKTLEAVENGKSAGNDRGGWHEDDTVAGLYYLLAADGKPARFIDAAVAHSDPAGAARYGYQVKPYNGYYFTVAKGVEKDGQKVSYERRGSKQEMKWEKGTFTYEELRDRPAMIAVPVDKQGATVIMSWSTPRCRFLDGGTLEYVPDGAFPEGWMDASGLSFP